MNKLIAVSSGILEKKHRDKIGCAIWEFLWLLDHVTKINSSDVGIVLGGKPIKWQDFGSGGRLVIHRNLQKLESAGYIKTIRAPYGLIITINKTKKIFGQKFLEDQTFEKRDVSKMNNRSIKSDTSLFKSDTSNKDKTVDKTKTRYFLQKNLQEAQQEEKKEKPIKIYERKPVEKQTQLHRIVYYLEDTLQTRITLWGKQAKALEMMNKAGYTEDQIKKSILYMATKDEFWSTRGFDLMNVANQLPRYLAQTRKATTYVQR